MIGEAVPKLPDRVLNQCSIAQKVALERRNGADLLLGDPVPESIVRREAKTSVQTYGRRVVIDAVELLDHIHHHQEEFTNAAAAGCLSPGGNHGRQIGYLRRPVDCQDRSPFDTHVPGIEEYWQDVLYETRRRDLAVGLAHENVRFAAVPPSRPILVGPHQAEGQPHVPGQSVLDWPLQELLAGEPVVVVHEAFDPGTLGERRLAGDRIRHTQVIETQVAG